MSDERSLRGQTIGAYKIGRLLGRGTTGDVYEATDTVNNRRVAVKALSGSITHQAGFFERFAREVTVTLELDHPNIIKTYDFAVDDKGGAAFVVLQLLLGGTLRERLTHSRNGLLPTPKVSDYIGVLRQIAAAVDHANTVGNFIHGDIKPSNIMLDEDGTAYLVDFGIVHLIHSDDTTTEKGTSIGTPRYMSPEQWNGEQLVPATDQYLLAGVAYYLLSGKPPFPGEDALDLMFAHRHSKPVRFAHDLPNLSYRVDNVLEVALAKDPNDRYGSATEFVDELIRAIGGGVVKAPSPFLTRPLPQPKRTRTFNPESGSTERQRLLLLVFGLAIVTAVILAVIVGAS